MRDLFNKDGLGHSTFGVDPLIANVRELERVKAHQAKQRDSIAEQTRMLQSTLKLL